MATMRRRINNQYPFKWGSTPYAEKAEGTPSFSFGAESRAERKFWIPWATSPSGAATAAWQAAADFLGYSKVAIDGAGNQYISRQTPHPFPGMFASKIAGSPAGFIGQNFLYATEIPRIEGERTQGNTMSLAAAALGQTLNNNFELDLGVGQFVEALMSVVYTSPHHNVMTDSMLFDANLSFGSPGYNESSLLRYVEIDIQPAGKYQVFKGFSTLKFDANPGLFRDGRIDVSGGFPVLVITPKVLVNDIPILLNEGDLMVRWKQVPAEALPMQAIMQTVGKTNNAVFGRANYPGSVNASWKTGTLLCLFPKFRLYRMINGLFCYDIDYRFKIYPYGANSFFRVTGLPPVPTPADTLNSRAGVKGIIPVGGIASGSGDLIVTSAGHGLITGDNVSLIIAGSSARSIGSWQVKKLTDGTFSLNNTALTLPPQSLGDVTHWIICAGFYPASRSGSIDPFTGLSLDPIFPYADYSLLFEPGP